MDNTDNENASELYNEASPKYYDSSIIFCPECGAKNEVDSAYCSECGAKLGQNTDDSENEKTEEDNIIISDNIDNSKRYCQSCGTELDDDMLFCPNCGTKYNN